jgi:hypothetical protein
MAYTVIAKPAVGAGVSKADQGDLIVDNFAYLYALRTWSIWIPLNGATALVAGDKAYWRVPAKYNGGLLVLTAAACKVGSSSGNVVLTVKNGATSMMTTNITIAQSQTDTTGGGCNAGVIDTAHDDLATGNLLEFSVVSAGVGVTYCGVEITVQPA